MRTLEIYPILNGWVVKAGCQLVAFTDADELLNTLRAYIKNPDEFEKEYLRTKAIHHVPPRDPPRDVAMQAPAATSTEERAPGIPAQQRLENMLRR